MGTAHLESAGHMAMMQTAQLWRELLPAADALASGVWVVVAMVMVLAALLIVQANESTGRSSVWSRVGRPPAHERAIRSFAAAVVRGNFTAAETQAARVLGENDP